MKPEELRKIQELRLWYEQPGIEVIVLGNGPSLARTPVSRARSYGCFTFGTNRSWTEAASDFHTMNDSIHYEELRGGKWTTPLLFSGMPAEKIPPGIDRVLLRPRPFGPAGRRHVPKFATDISEGVWFGPTPYIALQCCAHMGFPKVYIAGIDLEPDPETGEGHHYPGHPCPKTIYRDQAPVFEIAKKELDKAKIEVINLNPASRLEIWPKRPFDEVFPPLPEVKL